MRQGEKISSRRSVHANPSRGKEREALLIPSHPLVAWHCGHNTFVGAKSEKNRKEGREESALTLNSKPESRGVEKKGGKTRLEFSLDSHFCSIANLPTIF